MSKRAGSPSVEDLQQNMAEIKEHIKRKLNQKKCDRESSSSDQDPLGDSDQSSDHDDMDMNKENFENESLPTKEMKIADGDEIEEFPELDEETLELLQDDSDANKRNKFLFHPTLAGTWEKILRQGLKKEKKTELLDKYPRDGNCPIATPKLNLEIEASINETSRKRDRFFTADMDLCGSSLSALGSGISMIFNASVEEIDTKGLLACLVDAGKLLCELHNQLVKARKAYLYPNLDKKAKSILEKTDPGEFLFGADLSHKIKSAKSVEKLGLSLQKSGTTDRKPVFRMSNLNWRGPPASARNYAQTGRREANSQRVPSLNRASRRYRAPVQSQSRSVQNQAPGVPIKPGTS